MDEEKFLQLVYNKEYEAAFNLFEKENFQNNPDVRWNRPALTKALTTT